MQIAGKTVLVTGGTDGIGRQLALQLQALGADVVITGRDPGRLERARGEGMTAIAADLSGPAGVDAVLGGLSGRTIDVLINNAGMGSAHDFRIALPDVAGDERSLWLNLHAPIRLTVALIDTLRRRPEAMIVNVTSGLAIAPSAGTAVYCATKAGLRSYTQSLRAQLRGTSVHVMEALPPVVDTAMTSARGGSKLAAPECARQIIVAMQRNADEANVGMVRILKAVHQVAPWLARRIMIGF
jgi:uncharacterized oxidoreductase